MKEFDLDRVTQEAVHQRGRKRPMRFAYSQRPGKMISRFTTCLFAVVVLVLFCSSYASAAKVLFVVGGGSLNKGDQVTKNHLKARGFEVCSK